MLKPLGIAYLLYALIGAVYYSAQQLTGGLRALERSEKVSSQYDVRIKEGRRLFNRDIAINEPEYHYWKGLEALNARCRFLPDTSVVSFTEDILRDFDTEELAGVLAHEIAHLEEISKKGKRDRRAEWEVDISAAEMVGKSTMLRMLRRVRNTVLYGRWGWFHDANALLWVERFINLGRKPQPFRAGDEAQPGMRQRSCRMEALLS